MHFDAEHRLAAARPSGVFDTQLLGKILFFTLALEESDQQGFNRLLDLRDVTEVRLSAPEIFEIATRRRKAAATHRRFRTAIIVHDPLTEGLARIYEVLMQGSHADLAVFWDPKPAAAWLGVPEAALQPALAHHE
jgi:hypothetical protein